MSHRMLKGSAVLRAVVSTVEALEKRSLLTGEPHVVAGHFLIDTKPHRLQVQFDQDVSASLTASDLYVHKYGTDTTRLSPSGFVLDGYDHTSNTATFHYTGNAGTGIFADGFYRLTLYREDVLNAAAQPLTSTWSMDFSFKAGDVNRDLSFNAADEDFINNALDGHPAGITNATFTQGDLNYDGVVDSSDVEDASDSDAYGSLGELDKFGTTFSVFRRSDGTRELHWIDDCAFEAGYRIQVSADGRTFTTLVSQTVPGTSMYVDNQSSPTAPAWYRIRAVLPTSLTGSHVSGYGEARDEMTGNGLPQPGALFVSAIDTNHATVSWGAVGGDTTGYQLWISRAGRPYTLAKTVDASTTSIALADLNAAQNYTLRVRAFSDHGTSPFGESSFSTLAGRPSLITALTNIDPSQLPFRFALQFDQPVFEATPGALAALNASLAEVRGDHNIPVASLAFDSADHSIVWVTATPVPGSTYNYPGAWPEGFYQVILKEGLLVNAAGQYPGDAIDPSDTHGNETVAAGSFLAGDLNLDGIVNDDDIAILTAHYGQSGVGYFGGDVDRDGIATFSDLTFLVHRYNLPLVPPPQTPGQLVASVPIEAGVDTRHTIDLQWQAPTGTTISGYDILRGTDGTNFTSVAQVSGTAVTYRDTDLHEGKRYYYRVRSFVTSGGTTTYSFTTGRESAKTVLAAPTNLHVRAIEAAHVWIEWDDVDSTETMYRVQRTTTPADPDSWTPVGTGLYEAGSTWAEDTDLNAGAQYFYRVQAINDQTESAPAITQFYAGLPSPDDIDAVALSAGQTYVNWSLDDSSDEALIDGFHVERSIDGAAFTNLADVAAAGRQYIDPTTFTAGAEVAYRVVSYKADAAGGAPHVGGYSDTATITAGQTLGITLDGAATLSEGSLYSLSVALINGGEFTTPHWKIDWGDGSDPDGDGVTGEAVDDVDQGLSHTYADDGAYTITAHAQFPELGDARVTQTRAVVITNVAPTLQVDGDSAADSENEYELSLSATDPGRDTISQWRINWGDGTPTAIEPGTAVEATHQFNDATQTANIIATAVDEDGQYQSDPLTVTVNPLSPRPVSVTPTGSTTATVSWTNRSSNATQYVVQRADDADFKTGLIETNVGNTTQSLPLTGLSAGAIYYVRVGVVSGGQTLFDTGVALLAMPVAVGDAPRDFEVTDVSESSVSLSWTDESDGSASFIVERSVDGGSHWSSIGTAAAGRTTFDDYDIAEGLTLRYRVRASNGVQTSSASNSVTVTTLAAAPAALTATAINATTVRLEWADESDAETGYTVAYTLGELFTAAGQVNANVTSMEVGSLSPNKTYTFRVSALNADGATSDASEVVFTTPPAGPIPSPVILAAIGKSGLPSGLALNWDAAADATGYRVERSADDGSNWDGVGNVSTTSYLDTDIAADHTYAYRIIALSTYGEADPSNIVTGTTSLAAPGALTVAGTTGDSVSLQWTDNAPNETGFKVWQYTQASGGVGTLVATVGGREGIGTVTAALELTGSAYFAVQATTADAESAFSARVHAAPTLRSAVAHVQQNELLNGQSAVLNLTTEGFGGTVSWQVDWGDGTPLETVTVPDGQQFTSATHSYPNLGTDDEAQTYNILATATSTTDGSIIADPSSLSRVHDLSQPPDPIPAATTWSAIRTRRAILEKFNEIYNTIDYESYSGIMKGAAATRQTKRGNDWDQALLLKDEIDHIAAKSGQGVTAEIQYGVIDAKWSDVQAWLGVGDKESAAKVVAWLGLNPDYASGQPVLRTISRPSVDSAADTIRLWHATVIVSGAGFTSSIVLDPSWKFHQLRTDSPAMSGGKPIVNSSSASQFNEVAFVTQQSHQNPLEWYQSQVTDALYSATGANLRGAVSLADVPIAGPILPHNFVSASVRKDGYRQLVLPDGYAHVGSPFVVNDLSAVQIGPNHTTVNMYQRLQLKLQKSSTVLIDKTWNVADHATDAITLSYPESGDDDLTATLRLGDSTITASDTVSRGQVLTATLVAVSPLIPDSSPPQTPPSFTAGQPFAVMTQADQYAEAAVAVHERALSDDASSILADGHVTQGEFDTVNRYQRELLADLAARYALEHASQTRQFADLTNMIQTPNGAGWGFVRGVDLGKKEVFTTRISVYKHVQSPLFFEYAPESALSQDVGFDLPGLNAEVYGRFKDFQPDIGISSEAAPARSAIHGIGMAGSALESSVLENLLGTEGYSAAKGLQIAAHQSGVSVITNTSEEHTWLALPGIHNDMSGLVATLKAGVDEAISLGHYVIASNAVIQIQHQPVAVAWINEGSNSDARVPAKYLINNGGTTHGGGSTRLNPQDPTAVDATSSRLNPAKSGDPVQISTGTLDQDESILSLPTPGITLGFAVHYDTRFKISQLASDTADPAQFDYLSYDAGLGVGWSHTYSDHLTFSPDGTTVTWHTSDGQSLDFTKSGTSYQNPAGKFGTFTVQAGRFSYTDVDQSKTVFDESHRLSYRQDAVGNRITVTYSFAADPTIPSKVTYTSIDPAHGASRTLTFSVKNHHISGITDDAATPSDANRQWVVNYTQNNGSQYLKAITRKLPDTNRPFGTDAHYDTTYGYYTDPLRAGLLKTITRTSGTRTIGTQSYDYYANGRTLDTTNALGAQEFFAYDTFVSSEVLENLTSRAKLATTRVRHTDYNGAVTTSLFDDSGNVTTTINDDQSRVSQLWYRYDPNVGSSTDAEDGRFLPRATTDEDGLSTMYVYPFRKRASGSHTDVIRGDSRGLPTEVVSSSADDPRSTTRSDTGISTRYTYSRWGTPQTIITQNGRMVVNDYDTQNGLLLSSTQMVSTLDQHSATNTGFVTTAYEYYMVGSGRNAKRTSLLSTKTLPNGNSTSYTYDNYGQLKTQVDSGGLLPMSFTYDVRGNLISEVKGSGTTALRTSYVYDEFNRLRNTRADVDGDGDTHGRNAVDFMSVTDYGVGQWGDDDGEIHYGILQTTSSTGEGASQGSRLHESVSSTTVLFNAQDQPVQTQTNGTSLVTNTYDGQGNLISSSESG